MLTILKILKNFRLFFVENRLTFSRLEDILMLRSGDSYIAGPAVELLSSVISAKLCENQPSFLSFFAPEIEMPAQEDCIFVSCWAFLCASREQVLGWTFTQCVWRIVRLFLCLAAASCAGMILTLPRSLCFCSIVPTVMKSIRPEIRSPGIQLVCCTPISSPIKEK